MTAFQRYALLFPFLLFDKPEYPMGHRKAWTRTEEERLRAVYPELVGQPMALEKAFPGRSYAGIKMRVQKLGIQRKHKSDWS